MQSRTSAEYISILEQDDDCFDMIMLKSLPALRDLRGGGERETIRFFLKRTSCDCLKKKYKETKKFYPKKTGNCDHCFRVMERCELMTCSRCLLPNYCGRSCQIANLKRHKMVCNATVAATEGNDEEARSLLEANMR